MWDVRATGLASDNHGHTHAAKLIRHRFLIVEINIHRKGAKSAEYFFLYVFR